MCPNCTRIPLEKDFKTRVIREECIVEKRGDRGTDRGRCLGYMSMFELASCSRQVIQQHELDCLRLQHAKAKIIWLKIQRPTLNEVAN